LGTAPWCAGTAENRAVFPLETPIDTLAARVNENAPDVRRKNCAPYAPKSLFQFF